MIEAFADAILALDDSVPTGTYVDMCSKLPIVDPEKITSPTIVMRGQWDGIAGMDDLLAFFDKLPNPDKQFAVMPGISHASIQQKNYRIVYHILYELLHPAGAGLSRLTRGFVSTDQSSFQLSGSKIAPGILSAPLPHKGGGNRLGSPLALNRFQ